MSHKTEIPPKLSSDLARGARLIHSAKSARIVTHIDADGITAGSIASITLERLGIPHTVFFEKKISEDAIKSINSSKEDIIWICDLGSGYLSSFDRQNIIVTDHHVPDPAFRKNQTRIDNFFEIAHINPHSYGIDGSSDICGAGMTYLLSKEISKNNIDLAYLGVIGAVGDFQDNQHSKLVGLNTYVLADAVAAKDVVVGDDIRFFGRETRPLAQFLEYNSDPAIPGLSDDRDGCNDMLETLGIDQTENGRRRTWADLDAEEKAMITKTVLAMAAGIEGASRIIGEVYSLPRFKKGTGLGDAKEFSTILNSCGRYDDAGTGMRICKGDLTALKDAERNRTDHRRNISAALAYIKENHLIRERKYIQYFDAGSFIRETVVGIVAGMVLNTSDAKPDIPILAFADSDDGVKVSARATRAMTDGGLNLADVMNRAAEKVGGYGGGHSIAAGATIPPEKKDAFLDIVEDIIGSQLT